MRSPGRLVRLHAWLLLIVLVVSLSATAQVQNGDITGNPSGAVLANAAILVRNVNTGYQIRTQTNPTGIYVAQELNVGVHTVRVEAPGFKASEATDLVLSAGQILRVDFNRFLCCDPKVPNDDDL
jgi:hypothetical protein